MEGLSIPTVPIFIKEKDLIPEKTDPVKLADEMKRVVFRESLKRFRERSR